MASESTYWPATASEQAYENCAFVRDLLRKKQPEFAEMLELIAWEVLAEELATASLAPVGGTVVPRLGQPGLYR